MTCQHARELVCTHSHRILVIGSEPRRVPLAAGKTLYGYTCSQDMTDFLKVQLPAYDFEGMQTRCIVLVFQALDPVSLVENPRVAWLSAENS